MVGTWILPMMFEIQLDLKGKIFYLKKLKLNYSRASHIFLCH